MTLEPTTTEPEEIISKNIEEEYRRRLAKLMVTEENSLQLIWIENELPHLYSFNPKAYTMKENAEAITLEVNGDPDFYDSYEEDDVDDLYVDKETYLRSFYRCWNLSEKELLEHQKNRPVLPLLRFTWRSEEETDSNVSYLTAH